MSGDRGYFWTLFSLRGSPLAVFVLSGYAFGTFILVAGVAFGSTLIAVAGVAFILIWTLIIYAMSLLFDEAVNWLDEKLKPVQEEGGTGQARPIGPPTLPSEPTVCPQCGGRLFAGRPNCPHCSAPVRDTGR